MSTQACRRLSQQPLTVKFSMGLLAACFVAMATAYGADGTYTLYRNSPLDSNLRVHIATFDSTDGEQYNRGNCNIAADLFSKQQGVKARFWCEAGRFRR